MFQVKVDNQKQIRKATEDLSDLLQSFEKKNNPFYFSVEILSSNISCYLELDFSIEDFNKDYYYVANIGKVGDKEISIEKFEQSKAVDVADNILRKAVKEGLSKGSVGEWEQHRDRIELDTAVIYNSPKKR